MTQANISIDALQENVRHNEKNIDLLRSEAKDFRAEVNARFDKVDARFDKIEARFDKIDDRFEKIDARFNQLLFGVVTAVLVPIVIEIAKSYF